MCYFLYEHTPVKYSPPSKYKYFIVKIWSIFLRMSKICEFIGNCHSLVEVQLLVFYPLSQFLFLFKRDCAVDIALANEILK